MMDRDFVQYEEALALRELEFNEPCFAFFNGKHHDWLIDDNNGLSSPTINPNKDIGRCVKRPTYSQAFRWFRKEHNLRSFVDTRVYDVDSPNQWIYDFQIKMGNGVDTQPFYSGDFDSYEEAELACLRKLIEIVKVK